MPGGESKQETRQQSTTKQDPFYMSMPGLQQTANHIAPQWQNTGLTGGEQAAFGGLDATAAGGNPYTGDIGLLASDMFKGGGPDRTGAVQGNLDEYRGGLLPYTTMDTNPYSNEAFTKYATNLGDDAMNRVKAQYEAAGYNPSAASFGSSVAEGVGSAVAPVWAQERNNLEGQKRSAIDSMYGAGNASTGILSGMDQQRLANREAGIGVANSAMVSKDSGYMRQLELEAMKRGIPVQNIAQLANLILPLAGVGGTSNTDAYSKTTKQASAVETANAWMDFATKPVKAFYGASGGGGGGGSWTGRG